MAETFRGLFIFTALVAFFLFLVTRAYAEYTVVYPDGAGNYTIIGDDVDIVSVLPAPSVPAPPPPPIFPTTPVRPMELLPLPTQ